MVGKVQRRGKNHAVPVNPLFDLIGNSEDALMLHGVVNPHKSHNFICVQRNHLHGLIKNITKLNGVRGILTIQGALNGSHTKPPGQ